MIFGLFGGGSSSSNVPDIDYETPDSLKPFLSYSSTATMKDGPEAANYLQNLFQALDKGSLDQPTAMALANSRLSSNSSFYSSDKFGDFLNYRLPNEDQDEIIQGGANTVFYRDLDSDDLSAYKQLAGSMGKDDNPIELSNFIQTRMSGTLEAQNKYKDDTRRKEEAYYGISGRDEQGNLTGGYGVFGTGPDSKQMVADAREEMMGFDDDKAQKNLRNYTKNKMRAK